MGYLKANSNEYINARETEGAIKIGQSGDTCNIGRITETNKKQLNR